MPLPHQTWQQKFVETAFALNDCGERSPPRSARVAEDALAADRAKQKRGRHRRPHHARQRTNSDERGPASTKVVEPEDGDGAQGGHPSPETGKTPWRGG